MQANNETANLESPKVMFRRATNEDAQTVHRIVDAALREYGLHILLESSDFDLTDIERFYDGAGGRLEIIQEAEGGQALGILGWQWRELASGGKLMEIRKLYLAPAARGKGLGRRAVQRAEAVARSERAQGIFLETAKRLSEANHLYSRAGFRAMDAAEREELGLKSEQCDIAFYKPLTALG